MADSIQVTVEELRLRNFRAFEDARLTLSDLTFLVGRNGAGKSSILDAVALMQEAVSDSLVNALDRRGGLEGVRRQLSSEVPSRMGIAIAMRVVLPGGARTRAVYGFELFHQVRPYKVREVLQVAPLSTYRFERNDEKFDAGNPQLARGVAPPPGNLVLPLVGGEALWAAVLDTLRRLKVHSLDPSKIAEGEPVTQRSGLLRDGRNAADVLKALEGTASEAWIREHLAAVVPGLAGVRTVPLLGRRVLRFDQEAMGAKLDLDSRQISEGTLRALGFFLALRQDPIPSLLLVDEVENSVHPAALDVMVDAAITCTERMPVVLTTHSTDLLEHPEVSGQRVRVIQWREGRSDLYRLNPETQAVVGGIESVGSMLRSNSLWPDDVPDTLPDGLFGDLGA